VTAPITKNNPPQPTATRSAHSTTETQPCIVTLNGGGHGRWRTLLVALSGVPVDAETALDWGLVDALDPHVGVQT
jgi:hypothetical protein